MHTNRVYKSPKVYFTESPPRWAPFLCLLLQHGSRYVIWTHSITIFEASQQKMSYSKPFSTKLIWVKFLLWRGNNDDVSSLSPLSEQMMKSQRLKHQLGYLFTMEIWPTFTWLILYLCVSLSHWHGTTISCENHLSSMFFFFNFWAKHKNREGTQLFSVRAFHNNFKKQPINFFRFIIFNWNTVFLMAEVISKKRGYDWPFGLRCICSFCSNHYWLTYVKLLQ